MKVFIKKTPEIGLLNRSRSFCNKKQTNIFWHLITKVDQDEKSLWLFYGKKLSDPTR
jgi:hypothetical protein